MENKELLDDILAELSNAIVPLPKIIEPAMPTTPAEIVSVAEQVEETVDEFANVDMNQLGQDVVKDYLAKILLAVTHLKKEIKELKESGGSFGSQVFSTGVPDNSFANGVDINSPFPDEMQAAKATMAGKTLGKALTPGDLATGSPLNIRNKSSYPVYQGTNVQAKFPNGIPAGTISEDQAFAALDAQESRQSSSLMQDTVASMQMTEMTNTPEARRQLLQMNAQAGVKLPSGAVPTISVAQKASAHSRSTPGMPTFSGFSGKF